MPIPDFQTIMLPLLKYSQDKEEIASQDAVNFLADSFKLSEAERNIMLPSGKQSQIYNRVLWATFYLRKANVLQSTRRGVWKITNLGKKILNQNISKIDISYLKTVSPEFKSFIEKTNSMSSKNDGTPSNVTENPEELLETAYIKIRSKLADELLEKIKNAPPDFFERLVVELLLKMGYGGSRIDAGEAIGKSGDGGIDGIIKEDRLGLDKIYIQAKRWNDAVVGRREIQQFVGALQGQNANKGIFITTSSFTKEAIEYKPRDAKIVLIDGDQLAEYMIDYDLGVVPSIAYEIKRIDSDYFEI